MKIFLSFLQGKPNHPVPAYSFWEYYIKNGIEESNSRWVEAESTDWAEGLMYQEGSSDLALWKSNTWQKTIDCIKKERPDVFLSYLYPKQIDVNAIKEIQKLGIPCVNFFCDHVREYEKLPLEFGVFDLNWVPEYDALALYKKNNKDFLHLPMPMWVAPIHRTIKINFNNNISFIGSKDIQRVMFFNSLLEIDPDINLKIYGKGWGENDSYKNPFQRRQNLTQKIYNQISSISKDGFQPYIRKLIQRNLRIAPSSMLKTTIEGTVDYNRYVDITQSSLVTIGVNRYPSLKYPLLKPHAYSRLRDIEAPMLGACYLTEMTADLPYLYEHDEITSYHSIYDFQDKLKKLRSLNGKERFALIQKSQSRALNDLSITKSLKKIENKLFN